jgi:FtsP/CotA-like multicopper oxidase with cupredoxin domain
MFPGPTIIASRGTPIELTVKNTVSANYSPSLHLHGGLVAAEDNGHPSQTIPPGATRKFIYPNEQRGAMLWYRASTYLMTGEHVHGGLAGLYFVEDKKAEAKLRLPTGSQHLPLVIQDRAFAPGGDLEYSSSTSLAREHGHNGDTLLVNGSVVPFHNISSTLYRLRVLNGSNAQFFHLKFLNQGPDKIPDQPALKIDALKALVAEGSSTLVPFAQIGTDGGLLQRPLMKESLIIAPGDRVDLLVDFSGVPVGSKVVLLNQYGLDINVERVSSIMRFHVTKKGPKKEMPTELLPWDELPQPAPPEEKVFTLARLTIGGELIWTINGAKYSTSNPVLATVPAGSVQRWRFVNPTTHDHPIHIHGVQGQVVNLNGDPQDPSLYGWKDTFLVPPIGELTVVARFPESPGRYPFQCQVLEHQDFAMQAEYQVVPA